MPKGRNPRVDRDVRAALADLIETEMADPRLALVTLTDVEVTPDHDVATVHYATIDPDLISRGGRRTGSALPPRPDQVAAALEAAAPALRSMLARRVRLRATPELRFRPDPVIEQAERVERLLRDIDHTAPDRPLPDGPAPEA
jgi:ribosome-binding factor A